MPDSAPDVPKPDASALAQEMQASNAAIAGSAQAVQEAARAADEIAAEANAAATPSAAPAGTAPAAKGPAARSEGAGLERDVEVPAPGVAAEEPLPNFSPEVRKLLEIEVPVIVQLGVRRMSVGEVMRFSVGAIIEFQKSADEELELLANNKGIGQGHAVKVGENFGIKITKIGSMKETIRKLGAA